MPDTRPILLIEDDVVDAMIVRRALRQLKVPNPLVHTTNGEQALEYLRNNGNELPCVILMDLNTPRMSGIEFLRIIKARESLKDIPIVVMSTSDEKQDMDDAARLGAVTYLVKSADCGRFTEALRTIAGFWSQPGLPQATHASDLASAKAGLGL